MMLTSLLLAGWVAATASWTPMKTFDLVCTGSQTAYTEDSAAKQTLPWSETFTVDLLHGTYCSQGCKRLHPLHTLSADGIDLDNSTPQLGKTLKRFHASTGAIETNSIVAASPTNRFHLEQTGTCKIAKHVQGG